MSATGITGAPTPPSTLVTSPPATVVPSPPARSPGSGEKRRTAAAEAGAIARVSGSAPLRTTVPCGSAASTSRRFASP